MKRLDNSRMPDQSRAGGLDVVVKTAVVYIRQSRHKYYERTVGPEVQEAACRDLTFSLYRPLCHSNGLYGGTKRSPVTSSGE